jgi:hypothetical protein
MERVLIVARTRMSNDACVGGLALDTNRNVRLLRPGGLHQPQNTSFDKGHYIGKQPDLRNFLMQRVQPWQGGPDKLFDGQLVLESTSGYICRRKGIPNCSVGYWLPDNSLTMTYKNNKPSYQMEYRRAFSIKYVGFSDPIYRIPAGSLIRVSLARWWVPPEADEERCYLQLSGWFL